MPFQLIRDDLRHIHADAVVLPSNERLVIDGGSGLAIARIAGLRRVRRSCRKFGTCPTGSAVVTPAFDYPARCLVHTVGPVWDPSHPEDELRQLLRNAYDAAFDRAIEQQCQSVALPLLSTGAFGCPSHISLEIALESIRNVLQRSELGITLVLYDRSSVAAALKVFDSLASFIDDTYVDEHHRQDMREYGARQTYMGAPPAASGSMPTAGRRKPHLSRRKSDAPSGAATKPATSAPRQQRVPEPLDVDWQIEESRDALDYAAAYPTAAPAPPVPESRQASQQFDALQAPTLDSDTLESPSAQRLPAAKPAAETPAPASSIGIGAASQASGQSLEKALASLDAGFSETLLALIDQRGLTDAQVYKRANLSRQHFSKIRNDPSYRPRKRTVLALCVALQLDLPQTRDLLARAGYALSHASKFDVIVEYFILNGVYDYFQINQALYSFDQELLG